MDIDTLIAQWSAQLPPGCVAHSDNGQRERRCAQPRCTRPASLKANGEYAKSCEPCRLRRAKSCKRRRAALVADGGCRRCAYRKRREGDFLCARCREDRTIERARKRQDALDAAVIDAFAAQPDRVHKASNLDLGVSPWNARQTPEPSAAYWSPLPDPEPLESQDWRWSAQNGRLHHRY